jgi:hypothetical protein
MSAIPLGMSDCAIRPAPAALRESHDFVPEVHAP